MYTFLKKLCVKTNCYYNGVSGRIHNLITTITEREKKKKAKLGVLSYLPHLPSASNPQASIISYSYCEVHCAALSCLANSGYVWERWCKWPWPSVPPSVSPSLTVSMKYIYGNKMWNQSVVLFISKTAREIKQFPPHPRKHGGEDMVKLKQDSYVKRYHRKVCGVTLVFQQALNSGYNFPLAPVGDQFGHQ